ncbi:MAG: serine hydrolase domain-containing protein [Caulobacterales bacterium]|uniref:serine hydrolase domain-containing protein n=1 Tax=Glycocaulis sp. TaxID=1969725 RepID=UPI003FA0B563
MSITIHGQVAPGFEAVADAMKANFAEGNEIGAAFTLFEKGEKRVDIWAGHADRARTKDWQEDTLVPVFSTGKAITALVAAWAVDQGWLSYETPLADIWPEFSANGKSAVTFGDALSHQAGLPGFPEPMEPSDWFDRDLIEDRLADMAPMWPHGEGSGYHPITFGFLVDAALRRAGPDGRTTGGLLREIIAGPRGIDVHIGLPEAEHVRAAEHVLPPRPPHLGKMNAEKQAAFLKAWSSPGRRGAAEWRSAEFPAANTHATARGLAELMGAFANTGMLGGERLVSPDVIAEAMAIRVAGEDRVLPFDIAFGAGMKLNRDSGWFGPEPATVGHYGFGGSCAFADPVTGFSGAYVMNRQMDVLVGDPRAIRLIEAAYQ